MRKVEIVSLVLVIAALVVLIIALQMDYGSHRAWMTLLSFALLILSLDPKGLKKKKNKTIEEHDETEGDETGFIELAYAKPVDKTALNRSDAYLTFQDKLSDVYYYIHYVDGDAYEIYVSEPCLVQRLDYDELDDNYQTLDDLFETADNEEVDDIYTISAEDFCSVRKRYQDNKVVLYQASCQAEEQPEPVNRVGRAMGYVIGAIMLVLYCAAILTLPFMPEIELKTKLFFLAIPCILLLLVVYSFFTPQAWLIDRIKWSGGKIQRIKWLSHGDKREIVVFGRGKNKTLRFMDHTNLIQYEYQPKQKRLVITKTIQISLDNVKEEFDRQQAVCKEFAATHPFVTFHEIPFFSWLGVYSFTFEIPKSKATKAFMKELREWLSQPVFDSSNVCGYFKYNEYGGTFFIKYQNCRLDMLVYVHEDGEIEKFNPKVDSLGDESLSDEIKAFYVDLEDFYCWRIREEHRIDANEWPA